MQGNVHIERRKNLLSKKMGIVTLQEQQKTSGFENKNKKS